MMRKSNEPPYKGKHRYGYNRPKSTTDWVAQGVIGAVALGLSLMWTSANNNAPAVIVAVVAALGIIEIEWMARCEDRRKVALVLALQFVLLALWDARQRREKAQITARRAQHPGPPSGSTTPLDYGNR